MWEMPALLEMVIEAIDLVSFGIQGAFWDMFRL